MCRTVGLTRYDSFILEKSGVSFHKNLSIELKITIVQEHSLICIKILVYLVIFLLFSFILTKKRMENKNIINIKLILFIFYFDVQFVFLKLNLFAWFFIHT